MSNQQFVFPTPQFAQSTHNIRAAGLEARADITGAASTVPSFEQLKAALINENFISALGRHAVDDPARLDKLTLANVANTHTLAIASPRSTQLGLAYTDPAN